MIYLAALALWLTIGIGSMIYWIRNGDRMSLASLTNLPALVLLGPLGFWPVGAIAYGDTGTTLLHRLRPDIDA